MESGSTAMPRDLVDVGGEALLVVVLDGAPLARELGVVSKGFELAQLLEVVNPTVAEARGDKASKARIGEDHPAARRDAVGFVAEFLGREVMEITEQARFEQLSMQRGDTVDGVAADDGEMGHADIAISALVDDGEAAQARLRRRENESGRCRGGGG